MLMQILKLFGLEKKPEGNSANQNVLSSLAPKVLKNEGDIQKIQPYLDALDESLRANDVNNIALTGGYGSGKSTIIRTFEDRYRDGNEFLNISLASFSNSQISEENPQDKAKDGMGKERLERLLEVSILQQIFYHVDPSDIPESRFKRIINYKRPKLVAIFLGSILWLLSIVLLLKFDYLSSLNPKDWSFAKSLNWTAIISFIISFSGIGIFTNKIVRLLANSKINKLNIKGELELGAKVTNSVFNDHLEEILYFFEKTHYNVVVIEDLDRFDNTDIFTKLREINLLLNNSNQINRKIKFIYAIGDDLFEDKKERVKFFEYIIPVIPFINASNASEQLRLMIKNAGLKDGILSDEFIADITTFIDDIDMRLLTNIFHEFVIYRKVLSEEFIKKPEELFAIITYKNLDPEDFNNLGSRRGRLFSLINNKDVYLNSILTKTASEISKIKSEIESTEKEMLLNVAELRAVYIFKILEKLPETATAISIDGSQYKFGTIRELISSELFINVKTFAGLGYYQNSYGPYSTSLSFKDIEKEVDPVNSYDAREESIKNKVKEKKEKYKKTLEELELRRSRVASWDLAQIFSEIDVDHYLSSFSNNKLLRNLILEGYINENYNDYISLFHEGSITKDDFEFERNVKSGTTSRFDFQLPKVENLIPRIDLKYYSRGAILNFDLIDFLARNYYSYKEQFEAIIMLLSNEKENSIKFIDGYLLREKSEIPIFIKRLAHRWPGFWVYIVSKSKFTEDKENTYLKLLALYADNDDLVTSVGNESLKNSISQRSYFLSLFEDLADQGFFDKVSMLLRRLNVSLKAIDRPIGSIDRRLFEFVYENSLYEINEANLMLIFQMLNPEFNDVDFIQKNYSSIVNSNLNFLIENIGDNINDYVQNVFLKVGDEEIHETESSIIILLNNEDLELTLKEEIIRRLPGSVSTFSDLDDLKVKELVLANNKVVPSWSNVVDYAKDADGILDNTLIGYLNNENVYIALSKEEMPLEDEDFDYPEFRGLILQSGQISDESYVNLLNKSLRTRNSLELSGLSNAKIDYVLKHILNLTKENYEALRSISPGKHLKLLEKSFGTFLENIEQYELDEIEFIKILESPGVELEDKVKFIELIPESLQVDEKIAKAIGEVIVIYGQKIELKDSVFDIIIKKSDKEVGLKLINMYAEGLTDPRLKLLLIALDDSYSELFISKHRPKFITSEIHTQLFENLQKRNLIMRYEDNKKDDGFTRVYANT